MSVERFVAEQCELNDIRCLSLTLAHVVAVERLRFHHRDPFDRLLVVQARYEGMALIAHDPSLKRYGVPVI